MTKEQAIKILDQAVSQLNVNRATHEILVKALQFLAKEEVKPELQEVKKVNDKNS